MLEQSSKIPKHQDKNIRRKKFRTRSQLIDKQKKILNEQKDSIFKIIKRNNE